MKEQVNKWTGNEVEPRPNEDDMSVERWNNLLLLTCHPYGILLTADIFSIDISSLRDFLSANMLFSTDMLFLRDFLSATTENTDRAITSALSKSRRDDTLLTVCFSLRGIACSNRANEDILNCDVFLLLHSFSTDLYNIETFTN
jgi:hypothetical protein